MVLRGRACGPAASAPGTSLSASRRACAIDGAQGFRSAASASPRTRASGGSRDGATRPGAAAGAAGLAGAAPGGSGRPFSHAASSASMAAASAARAVCRACRSACTAAPNPRGTTASPIAAGPTPHSAAKNAAKPEGLAAASAASPSGSEHT